LQLIGCVILLGAGVQAGFVSNQARIYSLLPAAPSRANTIYMTLYFSGGALAAALGTYAWASEQWAGVCVVGVAMLVIALGIHLGSSGLTAFELVSSRINACSCNKALTGSIHYDWVPFTTDIHGSVGPARIARKYCAIFGATDSSRGLVSLPT
jgi:hypothetical protein